jgi:protein-L-isoaspartate(D-aspartate) O-methyltransferase
MRSGSRPHGQVQTGRVDGADTAERVAAALRAVPRRLFLPEAQQANADADQPLPIGHGQTNSQPSTVRRMLELLEVRPGQHVLDVGCGSAWTTALLDELTGPDGSVVGVELEDELAEWGRSNLAGAGRGRAVVHTAKPGLLGWPDDAPYDRILVSAQARELPDELCAQLAEPGIMVVPVAGRMLVVRRRPGEAPAVEVTGHYRFVPLR